MASIMEEDLEDVKILIIPEVSEFREETNVCGGDPMDEGFKEKLLTFLNSTEAKLSNRKRKSAVLDVKVEGPVDPLQGLPAVDPLQGLPAVDPLKGLPPVDPLKPLPRNKHQCKSCCKSFYHKSTLSRHKLLTHTANPPTFVCAHCNKKYKTKVSLRRHLHKVETNNSSRKSWLKVNCALCPFMCGKTDMVEHYETVHSTSIEKEIIKFSSEEAFHIWKHQMEINTTARYTKIRKDRIIKDGTKESFYRCHRDGVYRPRGNNLRTLKKLGSNKINGHCPAKMQVWINQENEVSVMFVRTHVGHDMDISRLTLTKQERDHIAQQLALQVPFDTILEACRESAVGAENIRRMNLLTRKDLYNIESSYSLSKLTYRNCLGVNVEPWVKEMISVHCDSFVKFYKPQGKKLEDYPLLEREDFLLVLMNEAQVEILKEGGNDYICIDTTTIASDFQLMTVLVLDERDQGFPVAFFIANHLDAYNVEMFFTTLKEATSMIFKPRIFISCVDDSVYKSWNAVMLAPAFRIYSPWIVDEDWRINLDKITNPEKQVSTYNRLMAIMEEGNVQTFEDELGDAFRSMKNDEETKEYAEFFEMYKSKASAWAHCFRTHLGLNVNEQIERIQTALKLVYEFKHKKVMQLERFIFTLMGSVKDLFDSLISFNNGFVESMKSEHQRRHARAEEWPKRSLLKKPKQWHVVDPESDKVLKVRVLSPDCRCAHSCPDCHACMHAYICSCVDSSLKWIVCEHVHVVCIKMKNGPFGFKPNVESETRSEGFAVDEMSSDATPTNLIINVPESAYQYMTVPADGEDGNVLLTFETEDMEDNTELILGYAEEDPDVNVDDRRSLLAQKCQNILNRISSEAQVAAFEQAMASLETDVTFIE